MAMRPAAWRNARRTPFLSSHGRESLRLWRWRAKRRAPGAACPFLLLSDDWQLLVIVEYRRAP